MGSRTRSRRGRSFSVANRDCGTARDSFEDGPNLVDFTADVEAESGKTVYIYRPALGVDNETLVARALKAFFFESVLNQ